MNRPLLVLCDNDEIYLGRLYEYLRENLRLSFEIMSFTTTEILMDFVMKNKTSLLVISESSLSELKYELIGEKIKNILVLDEEEPTLCEDKEIYGGSNIGHVSKYQSAAGIVENIVDFCVKRADDFEGMSTRYSSDAGTIIGFFTPIKKCGQTSLALSVGNELANKGRTVFLSFESFSSLPKVLGLSEEGNISDLIYYSESDENKFCLYLEKIKNRVGELDVIAPAKTAMQIKEISFDRLKKLFDMLIYKAGYEYIILDLTEYPEGLFDILRLCNKLFSVVKNDGDDQYKFNCYEDVLRENGYEDIIADTVKVSSGEFKYPVRLLEKEGLLDE